MIAERCGWEHVSLAFNHVQRRAPLSNHSDVKVVASRLIIPYHKEWEIGAIHSTLQRVLHRYQRTLHMQCNVHVTMTLCRRGTLTFNCGICGWLIMDGGWGRRWIHLLFSPEG